jgi:prepilin peptidase CpaA
MDKYLLIGALGLAVVGAVLDFRNRRIPNYLTYSGLIAAVATRYIVGGWPALKSGFAGLLLAAAIFCVLFLVGGMGGGDVKLMAAVAAWAGAAQTTAILLAAAIAGGILAVCYMLFRRQVLQTLLNTLVLIQHHLTAGPQPHPVLNVREPNTMRVPFGLAIAAGTLYCVGNVFLWR